MIAHILSIGTELTIGQTVDTNSAWLAQGLAEIGIETVAHATVSDDLERIREAIAHAAARADVVLVSGGLGPTDDDLTRQALAAAMGVELVPDAPSLEQIREFFRRRNMDMPQRNAVQALVPSGATPLPNPAGTAPGIQARLNRADVFVVPGVPREMKVMFEQSILPALQERTGTGVILQRVIRTFGMPEARLGEIISDLMRRGRNPTVGTTAAAMVIGVRINARGATQAEAAALLERDAAEIRARLGEHVFGEGEQTLQAAVAELLWRTRQTVSTAESCTGGLIAKRLTDVPGSSDYFLDGVVTYSNAAKRRLLDVPAELLERCGAVSREVAECMAVNCRRISGSDLALSVTGIAGPSGGTPEKPVGFVYLGLASAAGCDVRELRLGDHLTRAEIRDRTTSIALNTLRLRLRSMSA